MTAQDDPGMNPTNNPPTDYYWGGLFPSAPTFDANGNPTGYAPSGGGGGLPFGLFGSNAPAGTYGSLGSTGAFNAAGSLAGGASSGGFWSSLASNPWLRAGLGGLASYFDSRGAQGASRNAGQVNMTNSPWGPSEDYRTLGMQRALELLNAGVPNFGAGGGGGGSGGMSRDLALAMGQRALAGSPLYGTSNYFLQQLLGGGDPNQYRADLYGRLNDTSNPQLDQLIGQLFGNTQSYQGGGNADILGLGPGGGFGSLARGLNLHVGGGSGSPDPRNLVGIQNYLRNILDSTYQEGNPYLQQVADAAGRRTREQFLASEIPGLTSAFEGTGRYGSGIYQQSLENTGQNLAQILADQNAQLGYQDYNDYNNRYMEALGLGENWDVAQGQLAQQAADRGLQGSIANSQLQYQLAALEAQLRDSAANRASGEYLGQLGSLGSAVGTGVGLQQFGLGLQGSLAGGLSQDQLSGLGMVGDISGLPLRDLTAAFGPNLQLDQMANQRSSQAFQRQMQQWQLPWQALGNFSDIINAMSGGYGNQQGFNFAGQQPYGGNPWVQGALGALGGFLSR